MVAPISVVIPTHDRAPLLSVAIESVMRSALIEQGRDIIVVDDASKDETPAVVRQYGARYVRVKGAGPSGARNTGLALADSEFVAFLDDDDLWLRDNMAAQHAALLGRPAAAFAYGRVQLTTSDLRPIGGAVPAPPLPSGDVRGFLLRSDLQIGAVLFRRSMLTAAGGFDEGLEFSEDLDLLLRLAAKHPAVGVDRVGSLFRQRPPNPRDSQRRWQSHRTRVAAMRKWRSLGILPGLTESVRAELHYRGMTSYFFCEDASARLQAGHTRDAMRSLLYALRVSPAHALVGHRMFWSVLPRLVRQWT